MTSQVKTLLFLVLLTAVILALGAAAGGRNGLILALGLALAMNFVGYWFSDKIVLRMYRAVELSPNDAPRIHAMVAELAERAGLPKPKICLVPQDAPNAFATGRNPQNAVLAVTRGLLTTLPPEELMAVLGHELGHVKHRDILIQSVAAVLAGAVMFLAGMIRWAALFGFRGSDRDNGNPLAAIALAIVAPIAALMIQMAISRSREYLADEAGARLAQNPLHLSRALARLHQAAARTPLQGNPATENMFIVNPFSGRRMLGLFSTHPPVEERIRRLEAMAGVRP
ncbi:MAG: zinc metalloprotease HtpX [Desulfovibrionaceae bacterium]|nr:zinc metalloprotease HtpX [Desulfovibrionaceae bacterium]